MTMIYVVTSGSYSDYGIRAIFSTREKAEAYAAEWNKDNNNRYDAADIEEWPVDTEVDKVSGVMYRVSMSVQTGDVRMWQSTEMVNPQSRECEIEVVSPFGDSRSMQIVVNTPAGFDHAVKVAAEKRQEILRQSSGA